MAQRKRARGPVRGYGITAWGRSFAEVVESGADHRHVTGARRYFRDHHVDGLDISPGRITAAVRGSRLDPFEVVLTTRTVDPATVVSLLRRAGQIEALLALARGEQPEALRELIAPTESADVVSACTCPDDAPRCIHVLATAFEVADRIDRRPATLLRVMGTDLPDLLALAQDRSDSAATDSPDGVETTPGRSPFDDASSHAPASELRTRDAETTVFYGDHAPLPAIPTVPRADALTELDATALRAALRASGVGATQLAEALDDLAELYAVLRDHH